ncbi:uncharacterized protein B0J16DRAFT_367850 [Fusarium flagelliforme]|uniref:uncharacterized protein n=1 Tax=Fusarium flagelliforme TaxID=2675880 RepID=UPI001E8DF66C|nr:uncharacterized protein B0J16DRAFT_367850 [Fusarium flagelliforme]KAH7198827.1 hypothetical protein B0J16DRAFT_367850 [Fusarium flagelliforme]
MEVHSAGTFPAFAPEHNVWVGCRCRDIEAKRGPTGSGQIDLPLAIYKPLSLPRRATIACVPWWQSHALGAACLNLKHSSDTSDSNEDTHHMTVDRCSCQPASYRIRYGDVMYLRPERDQRTSPIPASLRQDFRLGDIQGLMRLERYDSDCQRSLADTVGLDWNSTHKRMKTFARAQSLGYKTVSDLQELKPVSSLVYYLTPLWTWDREASWNVAR